MSSWLSWRIRRGNWPWERRRGGGMDMEEVKEAFEVVKREQEAYPTPATSNCPSSTPRPGFERNAAVAFCQ